MQKIALKIFLLTHMFVSIRSFPEYEIKKSIELFTSEEFDSSPEINTRFFTDDANLLGYSFQPCHLSSVYSISPTFAYSSGRVAYTDRQNSNDKITVVYVDCENNKPEKRAERHRFPPGSWIPPGYKRGHPSGYDRQKFQGWGPHNHQQHPHQFQDPHNLFYPHGSSHPYYPNNHYLPTHNPGPFYGPSHPHYVYNFHGSNYPHESKNPLDAFAHSNGGHETIESGPTKAHLPAETNPVKPKCDKKITPDCIENDSTEKINLEVTTVPPSSGCPFSKNKEAGGCFNKSPSSPSVPSATTKSSIDYPDIDVRFGDEESTTVSSETTTKS